MKLLNLGCGTRYHSAWTNIDFISSGPDVIAHNLRKGIPFDDETFDVVYHSNVIEHFSKEEAPAFIKECYRVLKSNGVLRIAYPDLESLIYQYVKILKDLKSGNTQYTDDYDWIMLELLDQSVRNYSGGEMLKYFVREKIPNEQFVVARCGTEAKHLIDYGRKMYFERMDNHMGGGGVISKIKRCLSKMLGEYYLAYKIGRFRLGGEIHQWLYDSYSITRLLDSIGFKKIVERDAFTSYVENWSNYHLDTEPDGSICKPDSAYIEAIK
jgi:predicted SAM-dependent methyltransferase